MAKTKITGYTNTSKVNGSCLSEFINVFIAKNNPNYKFMLF